MQNEHRELNKELMKLIGESQPKEEITNKAWEVKAILSKAWQEYQSEIFLLDTIMNNLKIVPDWPQGYWNPEAVPPRPATVAPKRIKVLPITNSKRILDIAEYLRAGGNTKIAVKDIVERLRIQGDQRSTKNIATSVGNILTRSNQWKRCATGEYEYIGNKSQERQEGKEEVKNLKNKE